MSCWWQQAGHWYQYHVLPFPTRLTKCTIDSKQWIVACNSHVMLMTAGKPLISIPLSCVAVHYQAATFNALWTIITVRCCCDSHVMLMTAGQSINPTRWNWTNSRPQTLSCTWNSHVMLMTGSPLISIPHAATFNTLLIIVTVNSNFHSHVMLMTAGRPLISMPRAATSV